MDDYDVDVTQLEDPLVRESIKRADVIMGIDISRDRDNMTAFYGVAALGRIVRRDNAEGLKTIIIRYNQNQDTQLEYLVAVVKMLKGACCYDR